MGSRRQLFVTYQKSFLLNPAYLQQDAFDPVDISAPLERQKEMLLLMLRYIDRDYLFSGKDQARSYFTRLTGLFKNLNYSPSASQDYASYLKWIQELPSEAKSDQQQTNKPSGIASTDGRHGLP